MIDLDLEVITEQILAERLRAMLEESHVSAAALGMRLGLGADTVCAWTRGDNLKQPIRLLLAVDALGYDVVFRKRKRGPRTVRLT